MKMFLAILLLFSLSFSSCKVLKRKKCNCPDHRKRRGVAFIPTNSMGSQNLYIEKV